MIKLSTKKKYSKLVGISELASLFLTFLFQNTAPGPFSYRDLRETGPWNANCVMSIIGSYNTKLRDFTSRVRPTFDATLDQMCAKRAAFQKHWFSFSFISLFFLPFLLSPIGRTIRTLLYVKHTHENALERFSRRCCCVFESTPRNVDKCISLNRLPKSTQNCCFPFSTKTPFPNLSSWRLLVGSP